MVAFQSGGVVCVSGLRRPQRAASIGLLVASVGRGLTGVGTDARASSLKVGGVSMIMDKVASDGPQRPRAVQLHR